MNTLCFYLLIIHVLKRITLNNFTVADYQVFPQYDRIELHGKVFKLEPKIMEVLCLLVENQGSVLSKQAIAERLWPDSIVGLEVITRAIFELRKIFGCSAHKPIFIQTVARKGYCFIHPVEIPTQKAEISDKQTGNPLSTNRSTIAIILVLILAVILITQFILGNKPSEPRSEQYPSLVLVHPQHNPDMPEISPDGESLLFIQKQSSSSSSSHILLMDIRTRKQTQLTTGDFRYRLASWQTDEAVLYERCNVMECDLVTHDLTTDKTVNLYSYGSRLLSYDLSPSKTEVVMNFYSDGELTLIKFDLEKQSTTPIETDSKNVILPAYATTGKKLYYVRANSDAPDDIVEYDLESSRHRVVSNAFFRILDLKPMFNDELWVSAKRNEQNELWTVNIPTKQITRRLAGQNGQFISQLSTDSLYSSLIYKFWQRDYDISSAGIKFSFENVDSDYLDTKGIYVKEQQSLYFVSNRSSAFEIWKANGQGVTKITELNALSIGNPILSNDNNYLAFTVMTTKQNAIAILNLTNDSLETLIPADPKSIILSWSSDNENLVISNEHKKQFTVSLLNLETHDISMVALDAGYFALYNDLNNELTYMDTTQLVIMRKTKNNETTQLVDLSPFDITLRPQHLYLEGEALYFVKNEGIDILVNQLNIKTNELTSLFSLPNRSIVTQIGFTQSPYVIYDTFKNDISSVIKLDLREPQ